jgi:xanthosine utilization system XapX-like protein
VVEAEQDGPVATQEQRWATAELSLDAQAARRIRRTPAVLIAITGVLVVLVGITAVIDLRRLHTPRGAAIAWVEAATFGDCPAYLSLSRPAANGDAQRTDDEVCVALRSATAGARTNATRISLRPRSVEQHGRAADVIVEVRRPSGSTLVHAHLVADGDRWLVVLDQTVCAEAGCY